MLLEKEDEMDCLVGGANFLLKAIHHEAFMYENSQTVFTPSNCELPDLRDSLTGAANLFSGDAHAMSPHTHPFYCTNAAPNPPWPSRSGMSTKAKSKIFVSAILSSVHI